MFVLLNNFIMMYKTILGLFLCSLLSCSGSDEGSSHSKLLVVATTGMVADLVKNIGGDSVEVQALMGPGVDPHLYKATQGDLAKLQKADLILYNGLHLEGKMGEILEKLARIKTVIAVAENMPTNTILEDPNYADAPDPHIWFDVSLWAATIPLITETLISQAPQHEDWFRQRSTHYQQTLDTLHRWVQKEIQQIPTSQRTLITAHDAFNYFGRAYDMEVRGLQGISTLSEFGLKDRVDLVNFIVDRQIKAVFVETSVSEKNIQAIVEGCRQKGHQVNIGGHLFSDAMGAPDSEAGHYVGMVKANVATIVGSLKP